jgi:hypothetical protein
MKSIVEDIVPTNFELAQNYPNPFSNRTTIKFCIPDRMKIKLEVYNTDNIKVKTLVDEIKEAGTDLPLIVVPMHKLVFTLQALAI